jgi:hypothetical protein
LARKPLRLRSGFCRFWKEVFMARYKPVDPHLSKMLPVRFADQILPGKALVK